MDVLTYVYNYQPHTSTSVGPFEVVLSKPPGQLALNPMPTSEEPRGEFKHKWKFWLQYKMKKTSEWLSKAQTKYKNNYDAHLRKHAEVINADDYVYLRN